MEILNSRVMLFVGRNMYRKTGFRSLHGLADFSFDGFCILALFDVNANDRIATVNNNGRFAYALNF